MAGLRRLIQAVHVIRLELESLTEQRPQVELRPLVSALDQTLAAIAEKLASGFAPKSGLPPLRALHRELVEGTAGAVPDPVLVTELDEIVDAVNTVAGLLGIGQGGETGEGGETDTANATGPALGRHMLVPSRLSRRRPG